MASVSRGSGPMAIREQIKRIVFVVELWNRGEDDGRQIERHEETVSLEESASGCRRLWRATLRRTRVRWTRDAGDKKLNERRLRTTRRDEVVLLSSNLLDGRTGWRALLESFDSCETWNAANL